MAGFRDFQTGEVLTAANVNDFLMQQAVMKFADGSARDTALGTAVGVGNALREGMASYLDDADALQIYDGSAWATVGNAGIGSNVVQTVKTDTFSTTSTSFVDVTGATVSITPTSATSKVLVIAYFVLGAGGDGDDAGMARLVGGGDADTFVGDAASSRTRAVTGTGNRRGSYVIDFGVFPSTVVFLSSPASASAQTYKLQLRRGATNPAYVGRSSSDMNSDDFARYPTSLIAIEVAA